MVVPYPQGESGVRQRAYRDFVRAHHPDRGGDPETFVAGLAQFRAAANATPAIPGGGHGHVVVGYRRRRGLPGWWQRRQRRRKQVPRAR